jgi:hypothetical protein
MRMLTINSREEVRDEMLGVFATQEIKGDTVIRRAEGSGISGSVPGTGPWLESNMLSLVALDNDQMATLVTAVKQLPAQLATNHSGHEVALKLFLQPCEEIL